MNTHEPESPVIAVDAAALARVGTALADESRRQILLALLEAPAYPADLADRLGMTRGNVSNHLSGLRGCGLVTAIPEGRRVSYQLADPKLAHALADLAALVLIVDHSHPAEPHDGLPLPGWRDRAAHPAR
jgi:DNA-binding transcriptional ArsR family regulator